jgi:hypothetical protein
MENLITWALVTMVSAFIGSYLAAYLKKKGENLATHEDIDKLLDQVSAVTRTTKEIEARISSDVWDRQKQWEMKREVLFEAAKSVALVEERLMGLHSVLSVAKDGVMDTNWDQSWHKALVEWREALASSETVETLVSVVCDLETTAEFLRFRSLAASTSSRIAKKDKKAYEERSEELRRAAFRVKFVIRKELGVPTPQSTASSATTKSASAPPPAAR